MTISSQNNHNCYSYLTPISFKCISVCCLVAFCLGGHMKQSSAFAAALDYPWPTIDSSASQRSSSFTRRDDYDNAELSKKRNNISKTPQPARTKSNIRHKSKEVSSHNDCPTSCRCGFFLWDFISYIYYKDTMQQLRENTFEGRGGKKFVRIQSSNTVLQTYYPQLRAGELQKDSCILCGHSWKEHLEYWWWRRGRRQGGVPSAFERYLEDSAAKNSGDRRYAFHKQYVDEIDMGKKKRFPQKEGQEVRHSFHGEGVSYSVPSFNPLADGRPKKVASVFLLAFARAASFERLDDLIWLSTVETWKSKQQESSFS